MTATEPALKTREIILPRELSEFVDEQIEKKAFLDPDALIAAALYRFRDLIEADRAKYDRLRAELQIGIDELARGEFVEGDEMFERLHKKLDAAEMNGK